MPIMLFLYVLSYFSYSFNGGLLLLFYFVTLLLCYFVTVFNLRGTLRDSAVKCFLKLPFAF
jgi:hypothetical protein